MSGEPDVTQNTTALTVPDNSELGGMDMKKSSRKKTNMYFVGSRYMQQANDSAMQRRLTPTPGTQRKKYHTASTPSGIFKNPSFDDGNLSVVVPGPSVRQKPTVKKCLGPSLDVSRLKKPSKPVNTTLLETPSGDLETDTTFRHTKALQTEKVTGDADLDPLLVEILYSKEVLAAYLLEKEKKAAKAREEEALAELWALTKMNQELSKENIALAKELKADQDLISLYKNLTSQEKAFETLLPQVSELKDALKCLAESLDEHRATIPVRNMIVPLEPGDLIPKMESLISALTIIQGQAQGTEFPELTKIIRSLRSTLKSSEDLVARSKEQSDALIRLAWKEISLLCQQLQETMLPKLIANVMNL